MDIIDAVIENDIARLQALLDMGIDPNLYEDQAMVTPLHIAIMWYRPICIERLVAAGADINAEDCEGYTPLDLVENVFYQSLKPVLLNKANIH